MNDSHKEYLDAMGILHWVDRNAVTCQIETSPAKTICHSSSSSAAALNWEQLQQQVATCVTCDLHQTRTHTVFGMGNQSADLMIIGEAPGANEDRQGLPFVGRAGLLLDAMLLAIGLTRNEVYIANILKCRPPNNRDPNSEEVASCSAFLQRQVTLIQPKIILALGRIAAHALLNTDVALANLRGKSFHFDESQIPLYVTYHPAYLLRSPREKRKAFHDLLNVKQILQDLSNATTQE